MISYDVLLLLLDFSTFCRLLGRRVVRRWIWEH